MWQNRIALKITTHVNIRTWGVCCAVLSFAVASAPTRRLRRANTAMPMYSHNWKSFSMNTIAYNTAYEHIRTIDSCDMFTFTHTNSHKYYEDNTPHPFSTRTLTHPHNGCRQSMTSATHLAVLAHVSSKLYSANSGGRSQRRTKLKAHINSRKCVNHNWCWSPASTKCSHGIVVCTCACLFVCMFNWESLIRSLLFANTVQKKIYKMRGIRVRGQPDKPWQNRSCTHWTSQFTIGWYNVLWQEIFSCLNTISTFFFVSYLSDFPRMYAEWRLWSSIRDYSTGITRQTRHRWSCLARGFHCLNH